MTNGRRFNEQTDVNPAETPEGAIECLRDLALLVLGEPLEGREAAERIARRLYKDTSCGISFYVPPEQHLVVVAGYAEGTDAECPAYTLCFPFTTEEFWKAVEDADADGCELFEDTHCEVCGAEGLRPIEDGRRCEECKESPREGIMAEKNPAKLYIEGQSVQVHSFGRWYDGTVLSVGRTRVKVHYVTGSGYERDKAFKLDLVRCGACWSHGTPCGLCSAVRA